MTTVMVDRNNRNIFTLFAAITGGALSLYTIPEQVQERIFISSWGHG